jgi:DNA-binding MarR family transcriptional regulator
MKSLSKQLKFFINLSAVHSKVAQSFDRGLGNGVGFNDFIVLYHLNKAEGQVMRRIDLAEKMSMSASGITRMLLPMEKLGLITRENSEHDGRVSYVKLASGGKRLFEEAIEKAEMKSEDFLPTTDIETMKDISEIFNLFSFREMIN